MKHLLCVILLGLLFQSQAQFKDLLNKDSLSKKIRKIQKSTGKSGLTNEEVISGLKEALNVGARNSTGIAGALDGFYKNPRLFIPWPQEAQDMKARLIKMGFSSKVEEFEKSLNRAAEEAATRAVPVFTSAIRNMSLQDGFAILKGEDTAATHYLRKTTSIPLHDQFIPVVKSAIEKVQVTKYWNPLVSAYNLLPGVEKQNPDLDEYVTAKAINGLMVLIADEEVKIRKDPAARITDLLKKCSEILKGNYPGLRNSWLFKF